MNSENFKKQYPKISNFLICYFADREDIDESLDETQIIVNEFKREVPKTYDFIPLIKEMESLLVHFPFPLEPLTMTANMYLEDTDEAKEWIKEILSMLKNNENGDEIETIDS